MSELDKLNLERFELEIIKYRDEIRLRERLNTHYERQLDEAPYLKYILTTWIKDNNDKIKELNITIDYLLYEKKNFLKNINELGLLNENKSV